MDHMSGSFRERTPRRFQCVDIYKKHPSGVIYSLVNRVQSNWNILVEDFYRVRGIINVLYPTNYIPGLSRTNEYNPKH